MKKYSIALIDNMNNNFFSLARYLRDFGVDCDLFIIPGSSQHFRPECDTFEDVSEMPWIHRFPLSYHWHNLFGSRNALSELRRYGIIVACGQALSYLYLAGIKVDVFIPYGGDLISVPFFKHLQLSDRKLKNILAAPIRGLISLSQSKAITSSRVIIANTKHMLYKKALEMLRVDALNLNIPMVYDRYSWPYKDSHGLSKHDFIVFNHSRHIWASNPDKLVDFDIFGGNKRNDKVIKAFAKFLNLTRYQSPCLVTFEYGPDVHYSKNLIKDLGIQNYVIWFGKTPRKDIMNMLRFSNLGIDQLRNGLSGIGGTGIECLASGVPLITHTNGATKDRNHPFFDAPIIDVLEEDELVEIFLDYEINSERYKAIGRQGKIWFDTHLGRELAQKYMKLFALLAENRSLSQEDASIKRIFYDWEPC